jgi:membrane protein
MPREAQKKQAHGRAAEAPSQIPARGWRDILWRIYARFFDDRISLVAAGAAFYLLLALFPALTAFVSLYGFVSDPATIAEHISYLGGLLPNSSMEIIRRQLESLVSQDRDVLSISFAVALLVAFWSANNGVKTVFVAINIAYRESEKRSFLATNLIALGFTLGAMVLACLMIVSTGVVPVALSLLRMDAIAETLITLARWPVTFFVIVCSISLIYRYGPSRAPAKWRWISWGSVFATTAWIVASAAFSFYLQNFADYNATYGSLGAVIGLMLWTWISALILILGAEINAEMEHQTERDSTTGAPQPMGQRGAVVADTLGPSYGKENSTADKR